MLDPLTAAPISDRVAKATEVISVQADCSMEEAFDLLRIRAMQLGLPLGPTAFDVLDHIIRFDR